MANRDHGGRAWSFVKDHWDEIVAKVAPTPLGYVADGIRFLTGPEDVEDTAAFFQAHPIHSPRSPFGRRSSGRR